VNFQFCISNRSYPC